MSSLHNTTREKSHRCPYNIPTCTGSCQVRSRNSRPEGQVSPSAFQPRYQQSPFVNLSGDADTSSQQPFSTPSPQGRPSPTNSTTNRLQMQEAFLRIYFPAHRSGHETDLIFTKLLHRECLQVSDPAIDAAVNALCLFQLGTAQNEPRLLTEARRQYGIASTRFDFAIRSPELMNREKTLGAGYILGFCNSIFSSVPSDPALPSESPSRLPHQLHLKALQDLLLRIGPDPARFSSRYAQLLIHNIRHIFGLRGCCMRRSAVLASPNWKACAAVVEPYMSVLSDYVLTLPQLLEQVDLVHGHRDDNDDASARSDAEDAAPVSAEVSKSMALLQDLSQFERSLHDWLLGWYRSFEDLPYRVLEMANNRQFAHFAKYQDFIPPQAQIGPSGLGSPPFSKALAFPSFSRGSAHVTYWTLLLLTKHSIITISHALRDHLRHEQDDSGVSQSHNNLSTYLRSEAGMIHDAAESATSLVESLPWLTAPVYGLAGGLETRFVLCILQRWYQWLEEPCGFGLEGVQSGGRDANERIGLQTRQMSQWCENLANVIERRNPMTKIWNV